MLQAYLIAIFVILLIAVLMYLQIKTEKELIRVFNESNKKIESKIKDKELKNEFFIKLIYLNWIPYTSRGHTICFKSVKCYIYDDFVIFALILNNNEEIAKRLIYKKDIKIKFDIFAGRIIDIKVHKFKMTFQIYSRVDNFKIKKL